MNLGDKGPTAIRAHGIRQLRRKLDVALRDAAAVDRDGDLIEHLNHRILEIGHLLGEALNARAADALALEARRVQQSKEGAE